MNKFYSIASEGQNPIDSYQLSNLGTKVTSMVIGRTVRGDWGERSYESQSYYRDTTEEDYDHVIASKLMDCRPPYLLDDILNYHLNFYVNQAKGKKQEFLNQIRYVVLPIIKKRKDKEVCQELTENWLTKMEEKKSKTQHQSITLKNNNAPIQLQVNSDNSSQSQQITYSNKDIDELLSQLRLDIQNLKDQSEHSFDELNDEIEKVIKHLNQGKDIKGRLLTIGSIIKDIGIGLFVNFVSANNFQPLKSLFGLT